MKQTKVYNTKDFKTMENQDKTKFSQDDTEDTIKWVLKNKDNPNFPHRIQSYVEKIPSEVLKVILDIYRFKNFDVLFFKDIVEIIYSEDSEYEFSTSGSENYMKVVKTIQNCGDSVFNFSDEKFKNHVEDDEDTENEDEDE